MTAVAVFSDVVTLVVAPLLISTAAEFCAGHVPLYRTEIAGFADKQVIPFAAILCFVI